MDLLVLQVLLAQVLAVWAERQVLAVLVVFVGLPLERVLNRQQNLVQAFCVLFVLRLVGQRFVGDLLERLVLVVHLYVVRRVELVLFPFFALLNHEDFLFSEVLPLVFLRVVLFVRDFEQGFLDGLEVARGFGGVVAVQEF